MVSRNESQHHMVPEDDNISQQIANLDKRLKPEDVGLASEFESQLGMVSNPIFRRLFFLIRTVGTFFMVCCVVVDFTYLHKEVFSTKLYFVLFNLVLGFRVFFTLITTTCWLGKRVFGAAGAMESKLDPDSEEYQQQQKIHRQRGCVLYTAVPLTFFTGSYRLLNFRNFAKEVGTGLAIDFLLYILPMIMIQGLNNATVGKQLSSSDVFFSYSGLVKVSMILKFLMMMDLLLEFIMYLFELYKLNQLSQSSVDVVVRYNEKKRRKAFSKIYITRTSIWMLLIFLGLVAAFFLVSEQKCDSDQTMNWWRVCSDCEVENCMDCSHTTDPAQC